MLKKFFCVFTLIAALTSTAQLGSEQFPAQAVGGKNQVEQVFETQLTLAKTLLTSNFDVQVNASFDLDSAGHAINVTYRSGLNNALRNEFTRVLRFMRFVRTQNESFEPYPYVFSYHLSTERYNNFMKQRSKFSVKKTLVADSSFVIYTKAERAPEYYKNGEEGLNEFILSEMEYPKLAIEKSVEGTVVIDFVVETNGYVTDVTIKRGLGAGCAEEALRIIKASKWQPATLNNKLVRYRTSYPITFSLRNNSRDASSTIGQ